jgi:hypothetical protein
MLGQPARKAGRRVAAPASKRRPTPRRRNSKHEPFVYGDPMCPALNDLISEAFRTLDEEDSDVILTDSHCHALVLELMVTRFTLNILCPGAELPDQVREFVTAFGCEKGEDRLRPTG